MTVNLTKIPRPLSPPTQAELKQAFADLVNALMRHRRRRTATPQPPQRFELISAADLMATDSKTTNARDWARDPIDRALKRGIKGVGQSIYDLYGMDELHKIAEAICSRGNSYGRRMSAVDSALDGVGGDNGTWFS